MTALSGVTLHGSFLSAPTYKVALMLALTRSPFAYRHVDLSKGEHKKPDFLGVSRYGQVPALEHGGLRLVQSNTILQYLTQQTGQFGGSTEREKWSALEWLSWEADRHSPGVNRTRFFIRFMKPDPAIADYFHKAAEAGLAVLDQALGQGEWLVGKGPTIADIAVYAPLSHAAEGNFDLAQWPNVQAWTARLQALPGFKAPYDLLPKANQTVTA